MGVQGGCARRELGVQGRPYCMVCRAGCAKQALWHGVQDWVCKVGVQGRAYVGCARQALLHGVQDWVCKAGCARQVLLHGMQGRVCKVGVQDRHYCMVCEAGCARLGVQGRSFVGCAGLGVQGWVCKLQYVCAGRSGVIAGCAGLGVQGKRYCMVCKVGCARQVSL